MPATVTSRPRDPQLCPDANLIGVTTLACHNPDGSFVIDAISLAREISGP